MGANRSNTNGGCVKINPLVTSRYFIMMTHPHSQLQKIPKIVEVNDSLRSQTLSYRNSLVGLFQKSFIAIEFQCNDLAGFDIIEGSKMHHYQQCGSYDWASKLKALLSMHEDFSELDFEIFYILDRRTSININFYKELEAI